MALNSLSQLGCCCDEDLGYGYGYLPYDYDYDPDGPCCCDKPSRTLTITDTVEDQICPLPRPNAGCYFSIARKWRQALLGLSVGLSRVSNTCEQLKGGATTNSTTWQGCVTVDVEVESCSNDFNGGPCPNCSETYALHVQASCNVNHDALGQIVSGSWIVTIDQFRVGGNCPGGVDPTKQCGAQIQFSGPDFSCSYTTPTPDCSCAGANLQASDPGNIIRGISLA